MNTIEVLLVIAAAIVSILTIWGEMRAHRWVRYVCKPLATTLILALAAVRLPHHPQVAWWLVAGLAFSLLGDVLLMLPRDCFVAGLGSFLGAQICYIVGFCTDAPGHGPLWAVVPGLALTVFFALTILPRAGQMRWPVLIYALVIASMVWRASARYAMLGGTSALSGMIGAWLFCTSDLSLAWRRFVQQRAWLPVYCLGSYYLAQLLIALSF